MPTDEKSSGFGSLPLRCAYEFLRSRGLGHEADEIRNSRDRLGSYYQTLKRAKVLALLTQDGILDDFIDEEWPVGRTDDGRKLIDRYRSIYARWMSQTRQAEDMPDDSIDQIEARTFSEEDGFELPPPDIIAYNELRSCADLFRMHTEGILQIQPEYQREVVWKDADQTRFVDSLVKQLPIPSMCFSLDHRTQKWQVIDGLQRMSTIIRFLTGTGWTLSRLDDIDPQISGQSLDRFVDRNSDLHTYYVRVENLTLPITILRCDYSKKSHQDYIFMIFHRLNSGGARLNNQEIRNCIYGGSFNRFLKKLNKDRRWMTINKMKDPSGYRFIPEEIILRFFALHDNYQRYTGRLARFLNYYMSEHREPDESFLLQKEDMFNRTLDLLYKSIFEGKPPRKLSTSVLEAALVGVSFNLEFLETQPAGHIKTMYQKLLAEDEFSPERLREGIAGKERVIARMNAAKRVFSGS